MARRGDFQFLPRFFGLGVMIALLLSVSGLAESPLELYRARWAFAGKFALPVVLERPSSWTLNMALEPIVGYFVLENLEVLSKVSLNARLASSQLNVVPQEISWSVNWGAQYYFYTPTLLHPYAGLILGFGMQDAVLFSSRIHVELPLGILIAVSDSCAIDLGIPVKWEVSIRSFFEKLTIYPGFLGVRVFF